MDNLPTFLVLTIPPHPINAFRRPRLLKHDPHRVRESYRIMRRIRRQEVETILVDRDIDELVRRFTCVDCFEEHAAFVLVEELGCLVDVVVCAGVGATDDHYC